MLEAAKQAKDIGAERFDIVTSGDRLSKEELKITRIKSISGNILPNKTIPRANFLYFFLSSLYTKNPTNKWPRGVILYDYQESLSLIYSSQLNWQASLEMQSETLPRPVLLVIALTPGGIPQLDKFQNQLLTKLAEY